MPQWNRSAVPVQNGADTDLLTINCRGAWFVGFEVKNLHGTTALNNFDIYAKFSESGDAIKLVDASGDYTTPNYPVVKASGNLNALAAGATGWAVIDVRGFSVLVLKAAAAGVGVTVNLFANSY
jgi:hypothetical protein